MVVLGIVGYKSAECNMNCSYCAAKGTSKRKFTYDSSSFNGDNLKKTILSNPMVKEIYQI